mmetsp:Transcript_2817/g.5093  ORF Transcript_2817/g.5093 Transcript_2817/m.5093 type:complete len:148 (+) Transcript_2817:98-541(+)
MMQKLFLLFLAAIATGAEASWGEKSNEDWYKDCPQSETNKYSEECYKATCPPPFVCDKMTPDEWVEKALESYPRCCGDDLTECKCPVKDVWPPFKAKIGDYCAKVEICEPSATDKSVPSSTSGDVSFLRGGGVEDVNEQIQRKELSP